MNRRYVSGNLGARLRSTFRQATCVHPNGSDFSDTRFSKTASALRFVFARALSFSSAASIQALTRTPRRACHAPRLHEKGRDSSLPLAACLCLTSSPLCRFLAGSRMAIASRRVELRSSASRSEQSRKKTVKLQTLSHVAARASCRRAVRQAFTVKLRNLAPRTNTSAHTH